MQRQGEAVNKKEVAEKSSKLKICLEEKKRLMLEIHEITILQKKDVFENSGENINQLLDVRQNKMDRVDEVDREFLDAFGSVKASLGVKNLGEVSGADHPELAILKTLISEINDIINKTMIVEKEAEAGIKAMMEDVQKEMLMVQKGRKGYNAYENKPQTNDGYFIDRKK